MQFNPGDRVYSEKDSAEHLYFVYQGKINLSVHKNGKKKKLAEFIPGDFFGEECLIDKFTGQNAQAITRTKVLRVQKDVILSLSGGKSYLYKALLASALSRRYVRTRIPRWLSPDESVYFVARRHPFFVFIKMLIPILLIAGLILMAIWGFITTEADLILFSLIGICFSNLLIVWIWLEWQNDIYIVTSKRVLLSEKVILLHESRQEAPLSSILSTKYKSFQLLRLFFDYGTVRINTYTGSLLFTRIKSPSRMIFFIQGLQARNKDLVSQDENLEMEAMIRQRLRINDHSTSSKNSNSNPPVVEKSNYLTRYSAIRKSDQLHNDGETNITYRKHWFILIKKIWIPTIAMVVLWITPVLLWELSILNTMTSSLWAFLLMISLGFWIYQYLDWQNDIYVLTPEQIVDIERKPLGREDKKTAQLDNVLSLEHTRVGILGLMLNFGTVIINVGTEKFTFDYVSNPAQVQNEIFNRITVLQEQEEQIKSAKERERMADWLTIYHTQTGLSSD